MESRYKFSPSMEDRVLNQILDKKLFLIPIWILSLYEGLMIALSALAFDNYDIKRLFDCNIDLEFLLGFFIGGAICSMIFAVMGDISVKRGDPLGARNRYSSILAVAAFYTAIVLFTQDYDDSGFLDYNDNDFLLIATLIMAALVGGFMAFALYRFHTNTVSSGIILDNLSTCYLEIRPEGVCGIACQDVFRPGDGQFFELPYEDIRNIRASYFNPADNAYFSFFIDHKYGTFKLAIAQANEAEQLIRKKLTELKAQTTNG